MPRCRPSSAWRAGILAMSCVVVPTVTPPEAQTIGPAALTRCDSILATMHPDHARWIGRIRTASGGGIGIYAGLVRPGGRDPREPEDAPIAGPGRIHDLVIFPEAFRADRSPAWLALVLDHEYFHARHLSAGLDVPLVSFGGGEDRHYMEALAWGWVLGGATEGRYGPLPASERREVAAMYREHRNAFRRFVMEHQPSAWAHYGRFLREEEAGPLRIMSVASAP